VISFQVIFVNHAKLWTTFLRRTHYIWAYSKWPNGRYFGFPL